MTSTIHVQLPLRLHGKQQDRSAYLQPWQRPRDPQPGLELRSGRWPASNTTVITGCPSLDMLYSNNILYKIVNYLLYT